MGSRAEKLGLLCSGLSALNWERTMKSSAEIARQIEIPRRSEKTPALVLSSNDQPTEPDLDGIRKRLHLNLPLAPRQAHPWTSSSRFRSGIAFFFCFFLAGASGWQACHICLGLNGTTQGTNVGHGEFFTISMTDVSGRSVV